MHATRSTPETASRPYDKDEPWFPTRVGDVVMLIDGADATDEPLLREICRRIATDEWRHYAMFYKAMKRYLAVERTSRYRRLITALGRAADAGNAAPAECAASLARDVFL